MQYEKNVKVTSRKGVKNGPICVVGRIDIEIFETLSEAVTFLGSEEAVLKLVTTQHATNKKNAIRATANVTLSEKKIREQALESVLKNTDAIREMAAADEPLVVSERLIAEAITAIKDELEAKKSALVGEVEGEVEEEDEDDDS